MEREEYTRDNYPTSGKKYNGEKAIISLTSWRARINTVDKTIYSLIKQCPGFHIVLVLSEEEFPKKEEELPERLMLFVENELIELLWVYKNYRSFKKVLFTMDKYSEVPVISADDDLIYVKNYAEVLYQKWIELPKFCIGLSSTENYNNGELFIAGLWGYAQLFPPRFSENVDFNKIRKLIQIGCIDDDTFYNVYRQKYKINAFSFKQQFNNGFIVHSNADQTKCITKERKSHKIDDKVIYWEILK